jgi:Arc/MetJ-type ribon-helix-helix transcriptional regulator
MPHLGVELGHLHHDNLAIHQLHKVEDYVRERLAEAYQSRSDCLPALLRLLSEREPDGNRTSRERVEPRRTGQAHCVHRAAR